MHKSAKGLLLCAFRDLLDNAPDLEILGGIPSLIFRGAFPGAQKGAARGEIELVDVCDGERGDDMTNRGVDNINTFIRGICEIATAWRVCTTPEIPLRLSEPREGFVDRRGVKDTDGLLGSVSKLQRIGHD